MTNPKEDCSLLGCASHQSGWPLSHKSALHCPANDAGTFLPCQLPLSYAWKALEGHRRKMGLSLPGFRCALLWHECHLSIGISLWFAKGWFPANSACVAPQQTPLPLADPTMLSVVKALERQGFFSYIYSLLRYFASAVDVVADSYISYSCISG